MSPRRWGFVGPRTENPVGKTGILAGLALVIAGAFGLADDAETVEAITVVMGLILGLFGERVRRQPPEFRDPNDD